MKKFTKRIASFAVASAIAASTMLVAGSAAPVSSNTASPSATSGNVIEKTGYSSGGTKSAKMLARLTKHDYTNDTLPDSVVGLIQADYKMDMLKVETSITYKVSSTKDNTVGTTDTDYNTTTLGNVAKAGNCEARSAYTNVSMTDGVYGKWTPSKITTTF